MIPEELFQEAKVADNRNIDGFAFADPEEHDDLKDKDDAAADTGEDPAKDRDDAAEDQKNLNDGHLQSLTYMEHGELGFLCCQKSNDDTDGTQQIGSHGEDLVLGDVLRIKLCGMIFGISHRIGLGIGLLLRVGLLLELLELGLALIRIESRSNHGSTALRAVGSAVCYVRTTLRTKSHNNTILSCKAPIGSERGSGPRPCDQNT